MFFTNLHLFEKGILMTDNLKKAINNQSDSPAVAEILKVCEETEAIHKYDNLRTHLSYMFDNIKGEVVSKAFKFSHPSELYDEYSIEQIKEFVDEPNSAEEEKWELMEDVRAKFRDYYYLQVLDSSINLAESKSVQLIYEMYKTKYNPQSKLTLEEFAKAVNNPVFGDLNDTDYFNYSG
jgi:hypothetical protein